MRKWRLGRTGSSGLRYTFGDDKKPLKKKKNQNDDWKKRSPSSFWAYAPSEVVTIKILNISLYEYLCMWAYGCVCTICKYIYMRLYLCDVCLCVCVFICVCVMYPYVYHGHMCTSNGYAYYTHMSMCNTSVCACVVYVHTWRPIPGVH